MYTFAQIFIIIWWTCKFPQPSEQPIRNTVGHNKSKNGQATDYFKMALKAEPEREEWHKGLAMAMSKGYRKSEFTPDLNAEILEQLKKVIETQTICSSRPFKF